MDCFARFGGLVALLALAPVGGYDPGWEGAVGGRHRRLDPVGPFGNPDGSRADIEDLISEFVDFGGDPAFGHLATRANDSMVRVIVGKLGAVGGGLPGLTRRGGRRVRARLPLRLLATATSNVTSSPLRWPWRAITGSRSSSTPARRGTTRSRSCRARVCRNGRSSIASPAACRRRNAASTSAPSSPSAASSRSPALTSCARLLRTARSTAF